MPPYRDWPDSWDSTALLIFFLVVFLAPTAGYWLLVLDVRRYLRALRGALICVTYYFPEIPPWARGERPRCLASLGLFMPCAEEDVKQAYRRLAKDLHPDRGGDRRKFYRLQRDCELALAYVRKYNEAASTDATE